MKKCILSHSVPSQYDRTNNYAAAASSKALPLQGLQANTGICRQIHHSA
ncbi:hypothetical protein M6D81_26360 [Paenibacillus sp. J5C_2022]|nr:hypothetical protein [Paenibacillus sp. J5C2022]MCU6712229.1 hypothetical protein [Paenibacillus sp. J5C2022]